MNEFVYFIRDMQGLIKIGTSTQPRKRLRSLQAANGAELRIVGLLYGGRDLEQALHERWASSRLSGEWFSSDASLEDFIRTNAQTLLPFHNAPNKHASCGKMRKKSVGLQAEQAVLAERVAIALKARYPEKTSQCVAADVGVSVAAIRKLLERRSAPSTPVFGRMADAYGPAFVHAIFGFAWLDKAATPACRSVLEVSVAAQQAEFAASCEGRP